MILHYTGLFHALWGAEEHLWPLPTRCQFSSASSIPQLSQPKASADGARCLRGGVGCAELRAKAVVSWCTRESHWVTLTGPHPQVVLQALQSCITHETARAARKYFYTSLRPNHLLDKQSLRWLVMTLSTLQNKEWSYVDYFINPCKDFFKSSQLNGWNIRCSMKKKWVLLALWCLTLCDPMHWGPPGSSVHGILWARILEWVAIPFSRGSSQSRDWTQVSCTAGRFFTVWTTRDLLGSTSSFTHKALF